MCRFYFATKEIKRYHSRLLLNENQTSFVLGVGDIVLVLSCCVLLGHLHADEGKHDGGKGWSNCFAMKTPNTPKGIAHRRRCERVRASILFFGEVFTRTTTTVVRVAAGTCTRTASMFLQFTFRK